MEQREFIKLLRLAYVAGIDDVLNECEQYDDVGSNEKAHELMQQFIDSGDLTYEF